MGQNFLLVCATFDRIPASFEIVCAVDIIQAQANRLTGSQQTKDIDTYIWVDKKDNKTCTSNAAHTKFEHLFFRSTVLSLAKSN